MNDLDAIKGQIKRAFPEFAGYHLSLYAKVISAKEATGKHSRLKPIARLDLQICDHSLKEIREIKPLLNIPVLTGSRHVIDPPIKGDYILIKFPHGLGSTAIVENVLYDGRDIPFKPGEFWVWLAKKAGIQADAIELGKADDYAVLANKLKTTLINIAEKMIIELGKYGNLGAPLSNLSAVQAEWTTNIYKCNL